MNVDTAHRNFLTLDKITASIRSNIIAIVLILLSLNSAYGSIIETQYFSVQLPNLWIYKQDYAANDSLILIPPEFKGIIVNEVSISLLLKEQ